MDNQVIVMYSGKDLDTYKRDKGCGDYVMNPRRIIESQYLLIIRNETKIGEVWSTKDRTYKHNQAYMVAKVSGFKTFNNYKPARRLVEISEYIILPENNNFTNVRKKLNHQRDPIVYNTTGEIKDLLGLDIENLTEWITFTSNESLEKNKPLEPKKSLPQIIDEVKENLSQQVGIEKEKIHIKFDL